MKKIIIVTLLFMALGHAANYQIVNIKRGGSLNVRDTPFMNVSKVVDRVASNTTGINIKECAELPDQSEWCYIYAPRGASFVEGWVNSYYLKEMSKQIRASKAQIQNFLHNFYMAEEEDYMDKLQVFYAFPMQRYLWKENVSLMDLRANKVREYKKWPKRDYRLTYLKILKRKPTYIDVQTTVRWHLQRDDDYEKGKDIHKLRLVSVGNTFKVSALKYLKHTVYPKPTPAVVEENVTLIASNEANTTVETKEVISNEIAQDKIYIKSGSFFSTINKTYLQSITNNGFSYMIQKVQQGDKVIRRVFIGPFNSVDDATKALVTVRAKINEFAYIQRNISK